MPQRFAMLVLAAAAACQPASLVLAQQPAERPTAATPEAQAPTTLDAERIEGVGDLEFSAQGAAELTQDEMRIFGDSLRYNQEFGRLEGDGGVRMQQGVDRFFGPRLRYDTLGDTGVFEQPGFLLQRDLPARGSAEEMEFLGKGRYRLKNARFTTCAPGEDDWYLQAEQLELDYVAEEGRAEQPRLRFFDTTILGAPFATFPLENRRKSGILTPYYANSTTRGIELGVPYYWNIAPEYDATITPIYMTKRGSMLKNEFRYLNRKFVGETRFELLPRDEDADIRRFGISAQHMHNFTPYLTAQLDYNRVSDDLYFVDLASQVRQSSTGNLPQDLYLTYSGALSGASYVAQARVQRFQTLQDPNAPVVPPYHRLPQLNFTGTANDVGGLFDTTLPAEYVLFSHETLVRGSRLSATPTVSMPVLAPGYYFTPKAGLRYAQYDVENPAVGPFPARPGVTVPWMSLDSGLVFERPAHYFGRDLTQTLEPRLFYVYAAYRDQDRIPVFDTALADLNFPQLFTENRFIGGDRFGDANQLTGALTTRILEPGGQEALRATIGQRFYFDDERVTLTPGAPVRTFQASDLLASVGGRLFRHVTFDTTVQYNRRDQHAERYNAAARYAPEPGKVLGASYRFSRDTLRQIDLAGQWPMAPGWFAVGRYNYSLLDRRLVDGLAGVEYNAGCWVFRAVMQRIQTAAQVSSTAFFFQLEFNGVGQLGTAEVVDLLKRNVSGYSVSNPKDATLAPPGARRPLPFDMVY
ncbi:MAG TPA: LPS-assembly protein LptD [Burkholderiales bacterium]|nr:LPS-assembly protein LptD [Burkholderiales bacterium]